MPEPHAYTKIERQYYQLENRLAHLLGIVEDINTIDTSQLSTSETLFNIIKEKDSLQAEIKEIEATMAALKSQFQKDSTTRTQAK